MILKQDFFDQCCADYQKLVTSLESDIDILKKTYPENKSIAAQKIQMLIINFSKSYMLPKEYWNYCIDLCEDLMEADEISWEKECSELTQLAYFQFYYDKHLQLENYATPKPKLTEYSCNEDVDEALYVEGKTRLDYPHSHLSKFYRYYEINSDKIPSKDVVQKYRSMKKLYPEIIAAKHDVEKWFNLIIQVQDTDFIRDNMEYRIGTNLLNERLWKLTINYWKSVGDFGLVIDLYSKYCRFFLEDKDMLDEYKKFFSHYDASTKIYTNWTSFFDFEQMISVDKYMKEIETGTVLEVINVLPQPFNGNICTMFFKNYIVQNFDLPAPIILYVLNNANHRTLRKLFSTCKYFFKNKPTPICYRLDTDYSDTVFKNERLSISDAPNQLHVLKNVHITSCIEIRECSNFGISDVIHNLHQCDAKFVTLIEQYLTLKELLFLIRSKNVVEFYMTGGISDVDGDLVDLFKIMEHMPNIEKINLPDVRIYSDTITNLSVMKFNSKIHIFWISKIYGEEFDHNEFKNFCITNASNELKLRFEFDRNFDGIFITNFTKSMKEYQTMFVKSTIIVFQK